MSQNETQHETTLHAPESNPENLRLLQHIDYLEERLSLYENVPTSEETAAMPRDEKTQSADEWNIWPYSWAANARNKVGECFHSFHARLRVAQSKHQNACGRRAYEANLDEAELTLS